MKKMQCEVCGSTEIKKISEDIFECQSCGIQYSKSEVQKLLIEITGKVKIDHSDEVNNAIKRGEQFDELGNTIKATEYYNKALDLDAENLTAQQKIEELNEKKKFENFFVVEAEVTPQENLNRFLKELATSENIACDIYKEIEIKSTSEKYFTFLFLKNKCEYNWSAIACYKYYENQTVYKNEWDNEKRKNVKVPVTEKVVKIQRTPQTGTRTQYCDDFVYASDEIDKSIKCNNEEMKTALLEDFRCSQNDKYGSYSSENLDFNKLRKEDKYFYNGYELDLTIDNAKYTQNKNQLLAKNTEYANGIIPNDVGGDYYENLQINRRILSQTVAHICIPVQIVEYTYKGEEYFAISDLVSQTTTICKLYPCDTELSETKKSISANKNEEMKKWGIIAFVSFVITFIAGLLMVQGDALEDFGFFLMFGSVVVLVVLLIVGAVQHAKKKTMLNEKLKNFKKEVFYPKMTALADSYNLVCETLDKGGTIEEIRNLITIDGSLVKETTICVCASGDIKEFKLFLYNDLDEEESLIKEKETEIKQTRKKRLVYIIIAVVSFLLVSIDLTVGIVYLDEYYTGEGVSLVVLAVIAFVSFIYTSIKSSGYQGEICKMQNQIESIRNNCFEESENIDC